MMNAKKFWVIRDNVYKGITTTLYETYDEAKKEKESIIKSGLETGKFYNLDVVEAMVVFGE